MSQHFGDVVRLLREKQGWTQAELAQRVGRSRTAITMLETTPGHKPHYSTMKAYSAVFGLTLEQLITMTAPNYDKRKAGRPKSDSPHLNCRECGWKGSTNLIICPHCGGDLEQTSLN